MKLQTFEIGVAESTFIRRLDQTEIGVNPPSESTLVEDANLNTSIGANLL